MSQRAESLNELSLRGSGLTSPRSRERLIERLQGMGISHKRVLEAIRQTPRHLFVDEAFAGRAYEDTALPIGLGQTISQPYMVARMSEAILHDGTPQRVLEIGTGSGYQTAVLAHLCGRVYSVERIGSLLEQARARFKRLDLQNISLRHADGTQGWSAHAPYDAIVVTAAPEDIPPRLLDQLAEGGRMVIPVGSQGEAQRLMLIRREQGVLTEQVLEDVVFVPLIRGALA
ncbi:MAG: protein-L-isoaspartate(D-aspartate) O-methyltransferase [Pseudomonadota bacterium]